MAQASERHDAFAALRHPGYRTYTISRFASTAAQGVLHASIAWHVYDISESAFQLGLLGLIRFLPQLSAALYAGAVADAFDRKRIVQLAQVVVLACSLLMCAVTVLDLATLPLLYGIVLAIALASAFEGPARNALLPLLVPRGVIQNAITLSQTFQSIAQICGTSLAGVAIAIASVSGGYGVHATLLVVAMIAIATVHPRNAQAERRPVSFDSIREGLVFVTSRQTLIGAMTLDLFAVVFGGTTALLPIFARDILDVGPVGYGIFLASIPAGGLVTSLALIFLPPVARPGRALLYAVAAFGLASIVFGLSRSFPLSVLAYMAVGMSDQVSWVMRHTTIQLATPDELRGRVSSVSGLFSGTSNQLNSVESGFVAAATSATFAVVSGGVMCLSALGVIAWRLPDLRNYRAGTPPTVTREPAEAPAAASSS